MNLTPGARTGVITGILEFLLNNLSTIFLLNYYMDVRMDRMQMMFENKNDTFDFVIGKCVVFDIRTILIIMYLPRRQVEDLCLSHEFVHVNVLCNMKCVVLDIWTVLINLSRRQFEDLFVP